MTRLRLRLTRPHETAPVAFPEIEDFSRPETGQAPLPPWEDAAPPQKTAAQTLKEQISVYERWILLNQMPELNSALQASLDAKRRSFEAARKARLSATQNPKISPPPLYATL